MPGRRWPVMRERPPDFRLNPAWPLYGSLWYAMLGRCPQTSVVHDSSRQQLDSLPASWAQYWTYVPQLGRWAISFPGNAAVQTRDVYNPCTLSWTFMAWACPPASNVQCAILYHHYIQPSYPQIGIHIADGGVNANPGRKFAGLYIYSWPQCTHSCTTDIVADGNWHHFAATLPYNDWVNVYVDGTMPSQTRYLTTGTGQAFSCPITVGGASNIWLANFPIADAMIFQEVLSPGVIAALADPTNVDYRLGGVPLILPPKRRLWPVVFPETPTGKVPWHLFQTAAC